MSPRQPGRDNHSSVVSMTGGEGLEERERGEGKGRGKGERERGEGKGRGKRRRGKGGGRKRRWKVGGSVFNLLITVSFSPSLHHSMYVLKH